MRLPFVRRSRLDDAEHRIRRLEMRIFVLRDNMKNAKSRVRFNISIPDNAAAYCLLDQALIRDLEAEQK